MFVVSSECRLCYCIMTYAEKLKHPKWQKTRLRVFERDNFCCTLCKSNEVTLHVHHLKYDKSGNPWDTDMNDLITVCSVCHEVYEYIKKNDYNVRKIDFLDSTTHVNRYIVITEEKNCILLFHSETGEEVHYYASLSEKFINKIHTLINE